MALITKRQVLTAATAAAGLAAAGRVMAQPAAPPFVTRHQGVFNGERVRYVATVAETVVTNPAGAPAVRFVTTSYVREGVDKARRPVLFAFNGGPSSSSATLHMVALGPKRILVAQDLDAPEPPPQTVDNAECVLDVADIVMIDPPETASPASWPAAAGKMSIPSMATRERCRISSSPGAGPTAARPRRNTCWARATAPSGRR